MSSADFIFENCKWAKLTLESSESFSCIMAAGGWKWHSSPLFKMFGRSFKCPAPHLLSWNGWVQTKCSTLKCKFDISTKGRKHIPPGEVRKIIDSNMPGPSGGYVNSLGGIPIFSRFVTPRSSRVCRPETQRHLRWTSIALAPVNRLDCLKISSKKVSRTLKSKQWKFPILKRKLPRKRTWNPPKWKFRWVS